MGYRIIGAGLAGWAGVIWLAWWMADQRIALCDYNDACIIRATAGRDFVLTTGLTVALIVIVGTALIWARHTGRLHGQPGNLIVANRPRKEMLSRLGNALASAKGRTPHIFHSKLFWLALAAVLWLGAVLLTHRPDAAPASAWGSAPFADISLNPKESSSVEDNYDAAADNLEAMADATAAEAESDWVADGERVARENNLGDFYLHDSEGAAAGHGE